MPTDYMARTYTTLEFDDEEKAFADLGIDIDGAQHQEVNLAPSTYSFSVPGGKLEDDPLFPYEAKIIVRRDRVSVTGLPGSFTDGFNAFIGYRTNSVKAASSGRRGVRYTFQNAWYYVAITKYQQSTANWTGSETPVVNFPYTSDIELMWRMVVDGGGLYANRTKITNGEQIHDILDHVLLGLTAQSKPAAFVVGEIDPDTDVPGFQVRELMCSAAIEKCLELAPDTTVIFDYDWEGPATTIPKIHFKRKRNLTPVTVPLAEADTDANTLRDEINLTPRWDLVPERVIFYFRYIASISGATKIAYYFDAYSPAEKNAYPNNLLTDGPTIGPAVTVETFDMAGVMFNSIKAVLRVRECLPLSAAWWANHHPDFKDTLGALGYNRLVAEPTITDAALTISVEDGGDGQRYPIGASFLSDYPNELLDSVITDWMSYNGDQVVGKTVTIEAKASYRLQDKATPTSALVEHAAPVNKPLTARIVLTNGVADTYANIVTNMAAEPLPTGLARQLYESLAGAGDTPKPQWQGEHIKMEGKVGRQVTMANVLNLSGGHPDWETMDAQVQSVTIDEGTRETTVSVGPARHLNGADLRAVQYYNRNRVTRSPSGTQRTTGLP